MHLLVQDKRSLDDDAPAQELGQSPAPLVALSFSDADLGALAAAWTPARPELRLASLARLRHPMSTDLYLEQVVAHARCVVIRLLGGLDYWRYGVEETAALCRANGVALALLPGDARDDTRLRALSTVAAEAWSALDTALREGGPANTALALDWMAHLAHLAPGPTTQPSPTPMHGPFPLSRLRERASPNLEHPKAAIILYRSHLLSADTAPIEALGQALIDRGLAPHAYYVASLKSPDSARYLAQTLKALAPAVVLNATAFGARACPRAPCAIPCTDADCPGTEASPLDAPNAPVLQLVLAGSTHEAWQASSRGLSATDLAMQVVLPELDGRLLTGAVSFKAETARHPVLQYARTLHRPDPHGIALAADRAAGWARLAATPRAGRRLAILLSDYPGIAGQQGHAVGLDTFRSLTAILALLAAEGYATTPLPPEALPAAIATPTLSVQDYEARIPPAQRAAIDAAWGPAHADPAVIDGHFTHPHLRAGHAIVALQPDRGSPADRRATYHDPDLPPRHAYAAFHLWLHDQGTHALIQLGTHGSLEWLPGKSTALSPECWPRALLGGLPVIYPFIVNNPGEAAAAKRRLGAVTIGHLTPPIARAGTEGAAHVLERLLDEYAAADGLDRRRAAALRTQILDHAETTGLRAEAGAPADADPHETLARLDAYLCDVKDLLIRDGLHTFGQDSPSPASPAHAASPAAERRALLDALDARFIQPGPAGAPTRNRTDVLPTGRNLTTIDPRTIPTRTALALARRAAETLLRRHLQDHGEHPRSIVLDLWGSTAMRTGGEDLALAFTLLGATPVWDDGTARVSGFEIVPIALLDRPRIDVTLRISGLFRDAFPTQLALFDSLVQAIAARDEAPDWNPLAAATPPARIYGPAPGQYGAGDATAAGWRAASATAYPHATPDPQGLDARLARADAFVHIQDHAEQDLLDSPETAAHEGGFAAAAAEHGATPALYHLDTSTPENPRPRLLAEEVVRIVRARAANPAWIAGMMRHARSGAAEIARPLAALEAYARTLPTRFDPQFDLLHDATLGTPEVDAFLKAHNPEAHAGLVARFRSVQAEGLWHPRRNSVSP